MCSRRAYVSYFTLDFEKKEVYTMYIHCVFYAVKQHQERGGGMIAQIKAWGNGQGIRLTKELLESLGMHVDEYLNIQVVDGNIVLSKMFKHKTLEERTAEFEGELGPYSEFDWEEPLGREWW